MKARIGFVIAVAACSAGILAAVPAERIEPCCNVKSINKRTRVVTVTEKATKCSYEFQVKTAGDLMGISVGSDIRLDVKALREPAEPAGRTAGLTKKPAEPVGRPAEPAGRPVRSSLSASSAAATATACGSNVGRNAKTKTLCRVMTGPNSWEYKPC